MNNETTEVAAPSRPSYWGVDLDPTHRPGVPMTRTNPQLLANARTSITPQEGTPASPLHGRPGKPMPPVFGTAVPLRGLSGIVRSWAYGYADHYPSHWVLMMLGDRVEAWGYRARKLLPVVGPLAALFVTYRLVSRRRRGWLSA